MGFRKLLASLTKQADETLPVLRRSTSAVDEAAEAGLPAVRGSTIPTEVGPEVLGTGTSRASRAAGDIIDGEIVNTPVKVSNWDALQSWIKENPKKAAALGSAGIAGLAQQFIGGDEEQITPGIPVDPMAKEIEAPVEEAAPVVDPLAAPSPSAVPAPQSPAMDAAQASASLPPERPDFAQMMRNAAAQSESARNDSKLVSGGELIGAGLARIKPDQSSSEAMRKDADRFTDRAKAEIGAYSDQNRYDKAQADMGDEGKLRDTNSDISKTARELATKLGIKVTPQVSAKQLQDAGLPLGTLLSTQMAADSRREMAQIARGTKSETKQNETKLKVQSSVDKQTSQFLKSKDYEAYNAAKDAEFNLDQALASGNKTDAGTAFMTFAKIAQGDNSVVRDGDMAVLAGRMNYTSPTEMFTKLAARARGGSFNATELQNMKTIAAKVKDLKGRRVSQLLSPIVERAGSAGLNLDETLDPAVVQEFSTYGQPAAVSETVGKPIKLQTPKTPGQVITTRSGKTYKVNADGKTATEQ